MMTTTTAPRPFADSLTMIRRSMRLNVRNLEMLLTGIALPVMILLLFVYVFGGAIAVRGNYVDYVVPGVILLCTGFGAASTAVSVAGDLERGIVDRFRSMAIAPSSIITGHAVASLARNALATTLVFVVALAIGFRPTASPFEWLAVAAVLLLYVGALTWVAVFVGLLAGTAEAANGFTFFILFVPYLSSAFVPADTMPAVLTAVAEHQPVTPVTETVRGLLIGTPIDSNGWQAVAWCGGIQVVAFLASARRFRRHA